jgi:hypothetical protein
LIGNRQETHSFEELSIFDAVKLLAVSPFITLLCDKHRHLKALAQITRDITERKRTEAPLFFVASSVNRVGLRR